MDADQRGARSLLVGLVLGLAWVVPPIGVAALAFVTHGQRTLLRDRLGRGALWAALLVPWAVYLALVVGSGVTLGALGRRWFRLGGDGGEITLALAGLVVPLTVATTLIATRGGWVRLLSAASLATWVVGVPTAIAIGSTIDDPVSAALERLFLAPAVVAFGLLVAAVVLAWRGAGARPARGQRASPRT